MTRAWKFKLYQLSLLTLLGLIGFIFWNLFDFIDRSKYDEQRKMELVAMSQNQLSKAIPGDNYDIPIEIITSNRDIPMILIDSDGTILSHQNLNTDNPEKIDKILSEMQEERTPVELTLENGSKQFIYYHHSNQLIRLRWYSILLIFCMLLLILVFAASIINSKNAYESNLWTGLARETAHQLGTPISGLYGWLDLLKSGNQNSETLKGINDDIDRLDFIANRFSAIGTKRPFQQVSLVALLESRLLHFKNKYQPNIDLSWTVNTAEDNCFLDPELMHWVFDNILINAIDALKGEGEITVVLDRKPSSFVIIFSDNAGGIPIKLGKKIFQPGISTKSNGWGVGLSLAKRIVEDFHKGKIYFKNHKKGTSFFIEIPVYLS